MILGWVFADLCVSIVWITNFFWGGVLVTGSDLRAYFGMLSLFSSVCIYSFDAHCSSLTICIPDGGASELEVSLLLRCYVDCSS